MRIPQIGDHVRSLVDWVFYEEGVTYEVCDVEYPDECGVSWFYILTDTGSKWPVPLTQLGERMVLVEEDVITLDGFGL